MESETNNETTATDETSVEETGAEQPVETVQEEASTGKGATLWINGGKIDSSLSGEEIYREWPPFSIGDTVNIQYKIKEGDKERIQNYEGNVISIRGEGLGKSFVVRRISHDVGVERIFPYHSPAIAGIKVVRRGRVRRTKLYYLRGKSGKEGRIKELITQRPSASGKPAAKKKSVKKAVKKKAAAAKKKGVKKGAKKKTSKK